MVDEVSLGQCDRSGERVRSEKVEPKQVRGSGVREWSQSTEEVAQRAGALEPTHHTSHIGVGYQWMASLSVTMTYILMAMTTIEYGKHRAPNQAGG